ncbi:MAG: DUF3108 domain-containing protein [Proteobacteria bacterium]|nr:DUF3108 domain-containing protein [Pseudomonadota bacterium]
MRHAVTAMMLALLAATTAAGATTDTAPTAPSASAGGLSGTTQLHVDYDTYAAGLDVVRLRAGFGLDATRYRMALAYHTTGLAGLFLRGHQVSTVEGLWDGGLPEPMRFLGDGYWRGEPRRTLIDYQKGLPLIREMQPPNDAERDPVPPELQRNTVDTLSALALLMRRVADSGRCEVSVRTYDGRRVAEIAARTVGEEALPSTGRSAFTGDALRCDFDGRMLAGFLHGTDMARDSRLQHGSAWLARVIPGGPPVPVRMTFETRWFGTATMYMTGAGPGMDVSGLAE